MLVVLSNSRCASSVTAVSLRPIPVGLGQLASAGMAALGDLGVL